MIALYWCWYWVQLLWCWQEGRMDDLPEASWVCPMPDTDPSQFQSIPICSSSPSRGHRRAHQPHSWLCLQEYGLRKFKALQILRSEEKKCEKQSHEQPGTRIDTLLQSIALREDYGGMDFHTAAHRKDFVRSAAKPKKDLMLKQVDIS